MSTIEAINLALNKVIDPELHKPLPELGMVESVDFDSGLAKLKILLTISGCPMKDRLKSDIKNSLEGIKEITEVEIIFGVMNEEQRNNVKKIIRGGREKFIPFAQPDSLTRVIGIASGKGGVGKSSVTVNLAVAEMFKPERSDPVAYRGPLLHRVLEQLLSDAYWGDLDLLLLDLPPGTGDIAISLGQLIPNSEIIVVTTPQIAAAEVAERAGRIAHQIKQPVIGVIENMSDSECVKCGEKLSVFGSGGGEETTRRLSQLVGSDVPLLSKIPFDAQLREGGDEGSPIVLSDEKYKNIFDEILDQIIVRPKSLVGVRLNINT